MIANVGRWVVLDIESTGLSVVEDRIIDLALEIITGAWARETRAFRFHPGRPIPPESTAVHGIRDEDVRHCPPFTAEAAREIARLLEGAVLVGYRIREFDFPLLAAEMERVGARLDANSFTFLDPYRLWLHLEPRRLEDAVRRFLGRELKGAHGAEADARAAADVLRAQLEQNPGLPGDAQGLARLCYPQDFVAGTYHFLWNSGGEAVCNFGKFRGARLRDLAEREPGYLQWIVRGDFPEPVKDLARRALAGEPPRREPRPGGGGR